MDTIEMRQKADDLENNINSLINQFIENINNTEIEVSTDIFVIKYLNGKAIFRSKCHIKIII